MKIIRQYVTDDYVISEFILQGTHKGEFIGITPTNEVLEITGLDIDVTNLKTFPKEKNIDFYPLMLWGCIKSGQFSR